ncbi:MAG TPA: hypothetical protein ENK55_03150 [Actinobacteria bacterium]|nr:hypothetical protein [Actinomycetota bacterium]
MIPHLRRLGVPLPWRDLGLPEVWTSRGTTLGEAATWSWGWAGEGPDLGIPEAPDRTGTVLEDPWIDHVVLLVPRLDEALDRFAAIGLSPRLRMEVGGRPAAFFRVGPVLEVVSAPVRAPSLYGVALATAEHLEAVALRWRAGGFEVSDPRPALQPGRRILTVRGLHAGLAMMSPDVQIPKMS